VAGSKKRVSHTSDDVAAATSRTGGGGSKKKMPALDADGITTTTTTPAKKTKAMKPPPMDATGLVFANPELKPHPFFYYSDHSLEMDDDPLTPITPAGIVPTFPAKMHAILANPELADVVGWDPHGRSWRILKPRDFEIRILPRYFEHSKFSSFVRQANGWGFRRMSEGPDKNAYYHEYFLRAMPWLCKKMRRPKVAEKKAIDPEMEPDLNAISLLFPVPDRPPTSEVLVLQKTIEMGPRARMPVVWDTFQSPTDHSIFPQQQEGLPKNDSNGKDVEEEKAVAGSTTLKRSHASYGDLKPAAVPSVDRSPAVAPVSAVQGTSSTNTCATNPVPGAHPPRSTVAVTTVLNLDSVPRTSHVHTLMPHQSSMESSPTRPPPAFNPYHGNPPSASSSSTSDSQIAANFVAASAIHAHHIHVMLSNAFVAGMPVSEAVNQAMPYAAAATAARMGVASHHPHHTPHGATVGMDQMSYYLQAQQQQAQHHLAPRGGDYSNNVYGTNGNTNTMPNPLNAEAIQCLRQFEAFRAARGDSNSQFYFHPGGPK